MARLPDAINTDEALEQADLYLAAAHLLHKETVLYPEAEEVQERAVQTLILMSIAASLLVIARTQ